MYDRERKGKVINASILDNTNQNLIARLTRYHSKVTLFLKKTKHLLVIERDFQVRVILGSKSGILIGQSRSKTFSTQTPANHDPF
jgi:hypothetical protein